VNIWLPIGNKKPNIKKKRKEKMNRNKKGLALVEPTQIPKFITSLMFYYNKKSVCCQVSTKSRLYNIATFVSLFDTLLFLPIIYFSFFSFFLGGEI